MVITHPSLLKRRGRGIVSVMAKALETKREETAHERECWCPPLQ